MKRFLLAFLLMVSTCTIFAQNTVLGKRDFQVGLAGGVSLPVGSYKLISEAKSGFFSGIFVDKYFIGNAFGFGLDARYIAHSIRKEDTLKFENGFLYTNYTKSRFQNYFLGLGPVYKFEKARFQLEAYAKGGIMQQQFPNYIKELNHTDNKGFPYTMPVKWTANDSTNTALTWAAVAGFRFNYKLNRSFAVFANVDYLHSFGKTFNGKNSQFSIEKYEEKLPINSVSVVNNFGDYYTDSRLVSATPHQSVNLGIGVKYILPGKSKNKRADATPKYDNLLSVQDLQIQVKDKQTDLALSGVLVSIKGEGGEEKSITDANGLSQRITAIRPGNYEIIGEKNGIQTSLLRITEADFKGNTKLILKEIYHDDPRFTLVGETFDCAIEKNISGINTLLTKSSSKTNASQLSDATGKFIYQLDQNDDFSIVATHAGKYSQTETVTTKGLDRSQTLYVMLKLGVCNLEEGVEWVLKNIHYDFDKHVIREDAGTILDNVVAILKQNPTLRIELSSHTDSRGNDDYNLKLSQRRAESAVNYLIQKGISTNRLEAKGYGESKLLNHCGNGVSCSEQMHQENRRTEIKILAI